MSQTLNNIEFDMFYNVIRPFAKDKGRLVKQSSGGSDYFSLWFVRFQDGQMVGKYNPERAGRNGLFAALPLNNGARYKSAGKSVYGMDIEMSMGILPVNGRNVSGIVNIDLDDVVSTAAKKEAFNRQVRQQLVQARPGSGGKTYIFGNPLLISELENFEQASEVVDNGVTRSALAGIPMIGDWNLLEGTEAEYVI